MLPRESRRQADVVVSISLIGFGLIVILSASTMPWISTRTGAKAAQWFLSPGLMPALIGLLLILFSVRIFVTAISEGGHRSIGSVLRRWLAGLPKNRKVHRVMVMILIMGAYIFGGLVRVNFYVATSVFLAIAITTFWWDSGPHNRLTFFAITAIASIVTPLTVGYLFTTFLYVPMP